MPSLFESKRLLYSRLHYGGGRDEGVVRRRMAIAGTALAIVFAASTVGYWWLGNGQWRWVDCAYMVLITIMTVGYGEVLPLADTPYGRELTMVIMLFGCGMSVYFVSAFTAFIIEGDLREVLWRRKMHSRLFTLQGHYVVCGAGRTGSAVVDELLRDSREVVVIDQRAEALEQLHRIHGEALIGIHGDATDDRVLEEAQVKTAAGLVTSFDIDQDNLFVALSARQMKPDIRIVSRATERATDKILKAGANAVIDPTHIGGRRMAHELLRPNVVGFLDLMSRDISKNLGIEEVTVLASSPITGRKLSESKIREVSNALVLAVIHGKEQIYNPPPQFELAAGMTLIVLGELEQIDRLHRFIRGDSLPPKTGT
jgi:voltage-gated potassium channel